jgi:hypothetical protein
LKEELKKISKSYKVYLVLDNPTSDFLNPSYMISTQGHTNRFAFAFSDKVLIEDTKLAFKLPKEQKDINIELNKMGNDSGIKIIDQTKFLCPDEQCQVLNNGRPIYLDNSHIRPFFVRNYAKYMDEILK